VEIEAAGVAEAGEARRYTIERHEDVDEVGKARQDEIGREDELEPD
jgi:hypothetical protein